MLMQQVILDYLIGEEEGIAAGVRRIEMLTGQHALDHVYQTQKAERYL